VFLAWESEGIWLKMTAGNTLAQETADSCWVPTTATLKWAAN